MRKQIFKKVFIFSVLFSACLNAWAADYTAGTGSTATSTDGTATAVGIDNTTSGQYSTVVGYNNKASGISSSAFGSNNTASVAYSSAVGYQNTASGVNSSALGIGNSAIGNGASAFGAGNNASSTNSSAFGYFNTASGSDSSALGHQNTASGQYSTAVGYYNQASSDSSSAFGYRNRAGGARSYAVGYENNANGDYSSAIGYQNTVSGVNSSAVGYENNVSGSDSSAFGNMNTASGTYSYAFGHENNASGWLSSALGSFNRVFADYSTAIGYHNQIGSLIEGVGPNYPDLNTYVLGGNITTSASNAVVLGNNSTDGGNNTVSVGAANNLRKIVFVNDGTISATSKDAINGSQLNSVLQNATGINATNWKTALGITDGGNTSGGDDNSASISSLAQYFGGGASADSTGGITAPAYTITNISGDIPTANTYNNVGDALTALDNNTKTLNTSLLNKANKNADNLSASDITAWQSKLGNGELTSGNTGLVTGGVVADALALKADKNGSNLTASDITTWQGKLGNGTITEGNTGLVTGGTVATALQQKANQTEVDTIKNNLNAATATIDGKLNKDVDNISTTGIANIKNYAKEAVKVAAGDNVSVTTTEDASTNSKTYTVAVSNASIKAAIQNDLNAKADKNASNLVATDIAAWQGKLGNGANAAGNTGLITGNTLYNATKDLVNNTTFNSFKTNVENNYLLKNLSNLDQTDGKAVIMNTAREAVQLADGTNTTVEATTTGNVTTYKVNISNDEIKAAAGTTDLSNLLNGKANLNADNLKPADVIAWQSKLGNGVLQSGNNGLVTGGVVADALALKADKNGSNLSASDITTWQGKLGNGTIAEGNNGLVTGGTVATALQQKADKTEVEAIKTTLTNTNTTIGEKLNKDVDNISTTGVANIKNYAKEAVKVVAGDNVSVTTTEDANINSKTYTVAVSNVAIKAAVQNDLNAKANKNADNLTETDVKAWQDKLGNGELTSGNKGLVTGGVVADALALKADKTALDALANSVAGANTSLTTKADKDLANLSDTGVIKVKTLAKEAVAVKAGNNVNVSEEVNEQTGNKTYTVAVDNSAIKNAVKEDLDAKANKNADNLTATDVAGWQQKLGNGKVEEGNKGLVTGDTVNEAIVVVNKRIDEFSANSKTETSQTIQYLGGGATATEAPTYTITDIATGQNIEHNNVGSALQQLNNNQNLLTNNVIGLQRGHEELKRTVSQNRKEAQAGVAAAVAIASLPTSNEPGKTVFSMAGGSFKGQSAMAMGLSKRTENGKLLLKANASMNTRGDTAIGAGVGFVW